MLSHSLFLSSLALATVRAAPSHHPSKSHSTPRPHGNQSNPPSHNLGLGGPSTVTYTPYCVGSAGTCCYVGNQDIPACFWDEADMTGYLNDFAASHPSVAQGSDTWVDTLWITAGFGQNPQCAIDTGCLPPQYGADGTNSSEVKAVVAANAISKWMTYQKVNHDTLANTMNNFIAQKYVTNPSLSELYSPSLTV